MNETCIWKAFQNWVLKKTVQVSMEEYLVAQIKNVQICSNVYTDRSNNINIKISKKLILKPQNPNNFNHKY